MTVKEVVTGAQMESVKNGRMTRVGWNAGYLVIEYPGNSLYILGPDVKPEEKAKLLKVPYPDSLLAQLKKKHGWQSHKVGA